MKTILIGSAVLIGTALIAGTAALASDQGPDGDQRPPTIPVEIHKEPVQVIHAQRFQLDQSYQHAWRRNGEQVSSGWMLVLTTKPALLFPRQVREPVLYVGNQTAERINTGQKSGNLVVLVPGDFRLVDAPIFFGTPALPEEVTIDDIDRELVKARNAGVTPPAADHLANVVVPETLRLDNDYQLRQRAIDLVERFSGDETDLISGYRVPLVR